MNKEFVSISDFAESRGQSSGTVNAFIRKHPERVIKGSQTIK